MSQSSDFEVRFTDREITAWGGMALMRRMLQSIRFSDATKQWDLPQPGSNQGYEPVQIIEQFLVPYSWSVQRMQSLVPTLAPIAPANGKYAKDFS